MGSPMSSNNGHALAPPALVTGGCGFVGRRVVSRLASERRDVWIIDDLSTGQLPHGWLTPEGLHASDGDPCLFEHANGSRVMWIHGDVRQVLRAAQAGAIDLPAFGDVFHLAAVVGGRLKIDGDPLSVATDLSIDAEFFNWAVRARPGRILYASSSAAYPVKHQSSDEHVALSEDLVDFAGGDLGVPDMTYGWSKLTGEYLSRIAAERYGLHIACVRPFSGYGEDQDDTYPVPAIAARAARQEDPLTVWGSGRQGRDFVHIDDCVEVMLRVLDVIHDGSAVNIGSGRLTTFLEVARLFADLAGYYPEIKPLIDKPVGVQARYADTTLLTELLDWRPSISLEEGFSRVLGAVEAHAPQSVAAD